jgi:hypothetical protein
MASSWSEEAGPAVKQDVATLLNAAFDVTVGTFDGGMASRQFMILMDLDGALNVRMGYGADSIDPLIASVIEDEPTLRAVLVVPDCGNEQSPTLRGCGDHREGPAFDVTIGWRRRPGAPLLDIVSSQISHSDWWLFE